MRGFIKRHPWLGIAISVFFFLVGLPGLFDDLQEWRSWLKMGTELSWPFWRYLLLFVSFSGIVIFSILLLLSLKEKIPFKQKASWDWLKQENPDCTLEEICDYLNAQIGTDSPRLEVEAKILFGFRLVSEFLSQKLFEGKIKAWGKETKGRASSEETLIPREYWKFNRLNLEEVEDDGFFDPTNEKIIYTSLRFNRKRTIEQIELFFENSQQ